MEQPSHEALSKAIALHVQSWTTAGAFVVGTMALVLALTSANEQSAAINFQQSLERQAEQAQRAQYASRVAWDVERTSDPLRLRIENRSPAAIRDLIIVADSGRLALLLGSLAACTAIEVNVSAALDPVNAAAWSAPELMYFRDPKSSWILDDAGLYSDSKADMNRPRSLAGYLKRDARTSLVVSSRGNGVEYVLPVPAGVETRKRIAECCGG